ncbi:ParM/StbA family protein [uncultured Desulfobacter sp.]|uniref:ParM/StbA family protein n=1 Tax=uncultured Desulfobacter sp. TaxID=240139 RepID=UPI002AAAAFFD|nr:ParM/StbA family protein [uncultured Desulfobacter sp.]
MEIIGIDVGFGFTKAYNGQNSIIFKSLIGEAAEIQFMSSMGDLASTANLHITLDDKTYFLGSYAEQQSSLTEYTLDQEKMVEEFIKILALAATGICSQSNGPINVVTGLPVGYLRRDTKRLKQIIQGRHEIIYHHHDAPDERRKLFIDKVHVIPQPIGSIFNLIFDDNGKIRDRDLAASKLGVVDIGFKTTDFSIFDHLQYIERGSATTDTGVSRCFSVISDKLRQESGINIELYKISKYIESDVIKIRGKEYNVLNLKKRVYTHAASTIASDLNRLWENDWDIDSIIVSGGGSVPLAEYLIPSIEGNVISIPKGIDARFNNVQGYCKFGHYKWGKDKNMPARQAPAPKEEPPAPEEAPSDQDTDKAGKGLAWLRRQNG